ncbi:hypothetical protein CFC21_087594 [Triticum aestivum]|uniref:Cathepsin propeptide inhibitor domain-containing protein n=2 Tax=Triticum aestivum TaxID=4565 RepID=A0A9R1IGQ1_WHEAT|nr:uncharacterized protein LOC119321047 [Triticum dicoccoides]XP_044409251.1 uncharacterized protein LOC123133938 [Triticum aestivum]KAF7083853.1 hypothetical protein CFC21_087594 [Triticum aestivum]
MASKLLRMARDASRARTAAAAASRAAAMSSRSACGREESPPSRTDAAATSRAPTAASRSAREAAASGVIAPRPTRTKPRDHAPLSPPLENSRTDYELFLIDDVDTPTEKDLESEESQWAYYQRWCEAHDKKHDHDEMARRFDAFRSRARSVHQWNVGLPLDPVKAAIAKKKKEKVRLLLSKGKSISKFDECLVPMELGPFADEPFSDVEDVTAE